MRSINSPRDSKRKPRPWKVAQETNMNAETQKRFWAKVDRRADAECWNWKASLNTGGYGQFANGKKSRLGYCLPCIASRVVWEMTQGPIPKGLFVLHKCGNRKCVNPEHLYVGDQFDNMRDRKQDGREKLPNQKGSRNSNAKLDETKVREIRRTNGATTFGISKSAISQILGRTRWQHIQ